MTNKQYIDYTEKHATPSPCILNCIKAFFIGGSICCLGEALSELYIYLNIENETALLLASLTLILLSSLLTGIGVFDKIAKFGGAGALVPITGFSNSVTAPAIEAKSEGFVTGIAVKLFSISGPVIVYGTFASIIYGIIYYIYVM